MTLGTDGGPTAGSDWEELDSADIGSRLVERVFTAARRRRRVRRGGVLAASGFVAATAVAIPLVLSAGGATPETGLARGPARSGAFDAAATNGVTASADQYLAALRGAPRTGIVYVSDVVPRAVRSALRARLGSAVRFGARPANPPTADAPPLVVLIGLQARAASATVHREVFCGPGCGAGVTVRLARSATGWRATGTIPDWASALSPPRASSGRASSSSTTGHESTSSSAPARRSRPRS